MRFEFLVIFYKTFEGNRPPWYPPWKKNAPEDWWLEEDTFPFLGGGLVRGKLAVFMEWRFENSLHLNGKYNLKSKETIKILSREVWSEEFRRWRNRLEKAFGKKTCPLFYGFMVLTKKNSVDGCIKPCKRMVWSTYILTGTGFLPSTVSTRKTVWRLGHCHNCHKCLNLLKWLHF